MKFRFLATILAFVLAVSQVSSDVAAADADQRPLLTILIDISNLTPNYYRKNGKLVGPIPEITEAVVSSMGYSVKFVEVPWAEAIGLVARREADAITGVFLREERTAFLHYPEHFLVESRLSLVVPSDSELVFDGDLSVLDGQDIGAVLGWTYELFRKRLKIHRLDFRNEEVLVRNVAQGRIGLGIGDPLSLAAYAEEQGLGERVRLLEPPVEITPLYTAFSKKPGHDDLARRFSEALKAFKATPRFPEILHRHGIGR